MRIGMFHLELPSPTTSETVGAPLDFASPEKKICPKQMVPLNTVSDNLKSHALVGYTSHYLRLYLINWYKLVGFTSFSLVQPPIFKHARDRVSMLRSTVRNDGAIAVAWHYDQIGCDLAGVLEYWSTLVLCLAVDFSGGCRLQRISGPKRVSAQSCYIAHIPTGLVRQTNSPHCLLPRTMAQA